MRCEWTENTFSELIINHDRKRIPLSSRQRKQRKGKYPYYGAQGIIDYVDDYLFDGDYLLIAEDGENLKSKKMPIAQIAKGQFWVNNHAHIITANHNTELRFLLYLINSVDISSYVTGSAQPKLSQSSLNAVRCCIPPLPEQKTIAATLSCLDDKIELNNKINANLEAQAQAIFKSWFVDFEPFQDGEFVDSELGRIPKGWRVAKLADIAHYVRERIPVNHCNTENYVSTENMLTNRAGIIDASSLPTTTGVGRYELNDILISNIRPYFKKIWFADKTGGSSNDVLVIRTNCEIMTGFLYSLLYSNKFFEHMTATSKGTKMPRGDKSAIMRFPISLPEAFETNSYIGRFNQMVLAYQKKIQAMRKENQVLSVLRDTLLPKLMSGEIEVPYA